MTANRSSRSANGSPVPASMVKATESAWSGARMMARSGPSGLSRQRMVDAHQELVRSEREYVARSSEIEAKVLRESQELEHKAAEIFAEARAIEQEAQLRSAVMLAQARMEQKLADHITSIAERNALSILDRIREVSDSMMDHAGAVGEDLTEMMKSEAADQAARRVQEIQAVEEATEDEARAAELLRLRSEYDGTPAA